MTRYANVGIKRKYVESDKELAEKRLKALEDSGENLETNQPADPSSSATSEKIEVENAYKNRDENRRKEAMRLATSEKRRRQRQEEKLVNTTCFACRQKGHAAKSCPNTTSLGEAKGKGASQIICYRCGSDRHTLSRCKKPENPDKPLPFASCFVCSGKGHIASSCPKNGNKGVYPNGGSCKLCGETSHLARNCPSRKQDMQITQTRLGIIEDVGADEDDFHAFKRINNDIDLQERLEAKSKRGANLKVGVVSQTVRSYPAKPPPPKNVVNF